MHSLTFRCVRGFHTKERVNEQDRTAYNASDDRCHAKTTQIIVRRAMAKSDALGYPRSVFLSFARNSAHARGGLGLMT